jgi:integrase
MASGHVQRRGSAWRVIVYAGRDPVTGKKRQLTRTVRGSRRDAEKVRNELLTSVDRGEARHTDQTMADLFEQWYEVRSQRWSPKTSLETRRLLDRVMIPQLGQKRLSKVTTADLDRLYAEWTRSGGLNGRPLSPASVQRYHTIVRAALEQAVKWGWIPSNPARLTTRPDVERPEVKPPTPEQVIDLLVAAKESGPDVFMFLRLAAITGARRGELCGLKWSDIEDSSVVIARGIVEGADGLVEKSTKTRRVRRVAVDPETLASLRELRRRSIERAMAGGVGLVADPYIFSREIDGSVPWRPDFMSYRFASLRKRAGLEGVRLHDLRHAMSTLLLVNGVDVRTVAGRLGHANVATTLNVYSHFIEASDRHAAEVMADLLKPQRGQDRRGA